MVTLSRAHHVSCRHEPVRTEDPRTGAVTVSDGVHKLTIMFDDSPESPREWSNLGTMVCRHPRYDLGDVQLQQSPEDYLANLYTESSGRHEDDHKDEASYRRAVWRWVDRNLLILPLYLYDYSGLTMGTGTFQDFDPHGWDWGLAGFIYVTRAEVRKEYRTKIVTKKVREQALACLRQEVKTYSQFLEGDVYGYIVEKVGGEVVDSCWGFYGRDGMADSIEKKFHHLLEATGG